MPAESFSYTIYIRATPERIWQALTDPSLTSQFWFLTHSTDWAVGSTMTWHVAGVDIVDAEQLVLVFDEPRRLSFTWQTFTPEFGEAVGDDPELLARMASEKRSIATFDLEPAGAQTTLTITHSGFDTGSAVLAGVTDGWPIVLSSLKSLLETGEALAFS